ncbi:MAG TPA: hypothetical protein VKV21_00605 [Solirubrobacteraceae bacterium]|nr:hypothetical protein [Solirubrobacteraceae bacterium]
MREQQPDCVKVPAHRGLVQRRRARPGIDIEAELDEKRDGRRPALLDGAHELIGSPLERPLAHAWLVGEQATDLVAVAGGHSGEERVDRSGSQLAPAARSSETTSRGQRPPPPARASVPRRSDVASRGRPGSPPGEEHPHTAGQAVRGRGHHEVLQHLRRTVLVLAEQAPPGFAVAGAEAELEQQLEPPLVRVRSPAAVVERLPVTRVGASLQQQPRGARAPAGGPWMRRSAR